jgi:hypothetical protein
MRRLYDSFRPIFLSAPLGLLAAVAARFALTCAWLGEEAVREWPELGPALAQARVLGLSWLVTGFFAFAAVFFMLAALAGFVRRRWALGFLRKAYVLAYLAFWFYAYALHRVTSVFLACGTLPDGQPLDAVKVFFYRWSLLGWPLAACLGVVLLHVVSWKRSTLNLYMRRTEQAPARGDLILEDLRTHGEDPRYRKSWWTSLATHALVLVLIPWLLQWVGCVEPYRVPKGEGEPAVMALVRMVKPKKKEKKKKYILRPNAAIYFHMPDLDDSELLKEVQEMTELVYKADPNARVGRMGAGGGKKGGWPDGMDKGKVRFIRLEHDGKGWDDGMDNIYRADMNFLEEFQRLTGFPIAKKPESHPIRLLARYDRGYEPPFVYLTGEGRFSINSRDARILREYLLGGGMLFADCGHPSFDREFRRVIASVLPGYRLVPIADDDPLFQFPYAFPNGAPPLWHHGGFRALGIKHRSRWIVFYHPGDVNDAWKTGHSDLKEELVPGAFQMGVNIVYYSFTQYLQRTRKYRK